MKNKFKIFKNVIKQISKKLKKLLNLIKIARLIINVLLNLIKIARLIFNKNKTKKLKIIFKIIKMKFPQT